MGSIDILTIGDSCGKTALLYAMQQSDYKLENVPQLLHCQATWRDCYTLSLKFHGLDITVNLHDTAGQVF